MAAIVSGCESSSSCSSYRLPFGAYFGVRYRRIVVGNSRIMQSSEGMGEEERERIPYALVYIDMIFCHFSLEYNEKQRRRVYPHNRSQTYHSAIRALQKRSDVRYTRTVGLLPGHSFIKRFHNECRVLKDTVLREVMKRTIEVVRKTFYKATRERSMGNLRYESFPFDKHVSPFVGAYDATHRASIRLRNLACLAPTDSVVRISPDRINGSTLEYDTFPLSPWRCRLKRLGGSVSYTPTPRIGRAPRCPIAMPADYNLLSINRIVGWTCTLGRIMQNMTLRSFLFYHINRGRSFCGKDFLERRGRARLSAYLGRISARGNRAWRLRIAVRLIYEPLESGVPPHRLFFSGGFGCSVRLLADGRAKIAVIPGIGSQVERDDSNPPEGRTIIPDQTQSRLSLDEAEARGPGDPEHASTSGRILDVQSAANDGFAAHPRQDDLSLNYRKSVIIVHSECTVCIPIVTVKLPINDNCLSRETGSITRWMSGHYQKRAVARFIQRKLKLVLKEAHLLLISYILIRSCNMLNVHSAIPLIALSICRDLMPSGTEIMRAMERIAHLQFVFHGTPIRITVASHCILPCNDVELDSRELMFVLIAAYGGLQTPTEIIYLGRQGLRMPLEALVVRFKESINCAARKRAPKEGREGEIERGSGAIVRRINNAAGTRFRALYCRSAHISAGPSIVQDLSGLHTTYPLTGYIATTTTTTTTTTAVLRCLGSNPKAMLPGKKQF
ncbi:hypothetical protein EAG_08593 [Camponotus floridanus]|uniref:Uncharacterized protein n=1 Tax=Camponotus floridanus TaxID=104421 RepID=E1ZWZ0_CAMFO|nr:hypothetical protein EAG_08593 [Camponotus floridanus]